MKSSAIVALAGVIAIAAGVTSAAETSGTHRSSVTSVASNQNGDITPRIDVLGMASHPPSSSFPLAATSSTLPPTKAPTQSLPQIVPLGPVHRTADGHPVVYLTFDDGPSPTYTPQILAVLQRHHARATFFVEGRFAHRYPQLIAQELAAGNHVGNHTWTHPHLPALSEQLVRYQLSATMRLLRSLGAPAQCVRPPFGETSATVHRVESALGLREYLWTTETKDWAHGSMAVDLRRADLGLRPGSIIVFHDGHGSGSRQTVAAVDRFLTRAEAHGYLALPLPC